ncbi:MAG: cyanophycin synthetase, partial [Oscillospiraceae bacterium]
WKGATLVEDCYNCSPDSLRAAALTLAAHPAKGRRILVLSDMLELGEQSAKMHAECGAFVARQGIDMLMACGEQSAFTIAGANTAGMERCLYYPSKQQMTETLRKAIRPGDVVWLKASRGMALEEVSRALIEGGEDA